VLFRSKDSAFVAADATPAEPAGIPSGGAAQDINTSNVTINGSQLTPGTIPQTTLDVSNWGWGQTCAFSSTDLNTVSWGVGIFKSADGTSYNISAGNTGNMAGKTYIYLSLLDSTTTYLTTTTPATAVGIGKVLIAVANPDTTTATYNLSEATQIVGDNILANSINASKIITGQLIVGTNVGLGTAQDSSGVTTIIGNTVTTGFVNALSIKAGSVAAENITGTTISGKTIIGSTLQTATSGWNVNITLDTVQIRNGSTVMGYWQGNNPIANQAYLETYEIGVDYLDVDQIRGLSNTNIIYCRGLYPSSNGGYSLGSTSYYWSTCHANVLTGPSGSIELNQSGRIQVNTHFDPNSAGSLNSGGSVRYWNDISYKTLTDRGCLGWFDEGVELQDGKIVSDIEAIKNMKKHPTKKTIYGVPMLDYTTFPKVSYKKAARHDGTFLLRDKNDEPYETETDKDTGKDKIIKAQDGIEMTSVFSIMIGALKELDNRIKILEENKIK
jgi:hypothetical protein